MGSSERALEAGRVLPRRAPLQVQLVLQLSDRLRQPPLTIAAATTALTLTLLGCPKAAEAARVAHTLAQIGCGTKDELVVVLRGGGPLRAVRGLGFDLEGLALRLREPLSRRRLRR